MWYDWAFFFVQAAHWSVICQAMEGHVRRALSSGWSLPSLKELEQPDMSMQGKGGGIIDGGGWWWW